MSFLTFVGEESMKQNVDSNILQNVVHKNQISQKFKESNGKDIFGERKTSNNEAIIKKTAYIFDSEEEPSPGKQSIQTEKPIKSYRSIDDVSEIIESLSRDTSLPASPRAQFAVTICSCQIHNEQIKSYNFCVQCTTYLLCSSCIKTQHSSHMILTFKSESEAKNLTKQFLIDRLDDAIRKLKSKQNDIKNKSVELQLIINRVKKMQEEVINKLTSVFEEIGNILRMIYEKDQEKFQKKTDQFYLRYNEVADGLREHLLIIIDGGFQMSNFNQSSIKKSFPEVPNQQINKLKFILEKTKKFYKSLSDSLDQLRIKTLQNAQLNNSTTCNRISLQSFQTSTKKYQKFLSDSYLNDNGTKTSLLKVLDSISK